MKEFELLTQLLKTQDGLLLNVDRLCDNLTNEAYKAGKDPITDIIVNASQYNNRETALTDIKFAINQLQKALGELE